ncbi:MAG: DUF3168 domain-containing protein [Bdellovibrionales bacterium]
MSGTLFAVQQAVFGKLAADTAVQSLLGDPPRLYDHVPADAAFPYVAFGPLSAQPFDDLARSGYTLSLALTVWSRYRGGKEAKDILQAVYDALHRADLAVAGAVFVSCEFAGCDVAVENDGLTWRGEIRFTIYIQDS